MGGLSIIPGFEFSPKRLLLQCPPAPRRPGAPARRLSVEEFWCGVHSRHSPKNSQCCDLLASKSASSVASSCSWEQYHQRCKDWGMECVTPISLTAGSFPGAEGNEPLFGALLLPLPLHLSWCWRQANGQQRKVNGMDEMHPFCISTWEGIQKQVPHSPLGVWESAPELNFFKTRFRAPGKKRSHHAHSGHLCFPEEKKGREGWSTYQSFGWEVTWASVLTIPDGHYSAFINWLYNFLSS